MGFIIGCGHENDRAAPLSVIEYCQTHQELLNQEAEEERGISLEPKVSQTS